ncbi:MAG: acylneuraminate cytidylyltransferase family protein [Planctomycetota bacterium]
MTCLTAIIPAKSYSERFPNKNIRNFLGRPLLWYTIQCALNSDSIKRIIVSTDNNETAEMAEKYGAEVPFLRPQELSCPDTPMKDVITHAFNTVVNDESLVVLQPTSPLRLPCDIDGAANLFFSYENAGVGSVVPLKTPGGIFTLSSDFRACPLNYCSRNSKIFTFNGAVYIVKRKVIDGGIFLGNNFSAYLMPQERSVDIDFELDLKTAHFLAKENKLDEIFNQWEKNRR